MKNSIPSIRTSVSRSSWRFFTAISFCFACGAGVLRATPAPTYSFDTGAGAEQISVGGSPADANIAASITHVCVTARGAFACYAKGGALVSPGPRLSARPYEAKDFFTKLGILANPISSGSFAKDGRVVFDHYRKRFFMAFQTREEHARLLIAVSKSEDPRDGWWTYADKVEDAAANGQDYMWMGVNASHLLISNNMWKCTGTYGTDSWDCKTSKAATFRTRYLMYSAAELAAGLPYTRTEWSDPAVKGWAVPCVHDSYTTDAFWVHRDDDTHVSVWAVRNGQVSSQQVSIKTSTGTVNGRELGVTGSHGGNVVDYGNIGQAPQNAQYRDGKIVFVSNDGHTWSGQSDSNNAVRVVRIDVSKYFDASPSIKVENQQIFGRASADDPSGSIFDYGWPAVATNANGDIVVGSIRSNSTIFPELRASVWFAGQPAISSSVLLQKSSSAPVLSCSEKPDDATKPCVSEFHMAGASADPSTSGVYLAQEYGSFSPPWRIHVAKMLGQVMPDVIATQIQPPATIAHGTSGTVTVTVVNQGDGPMSSSAGTLYLSTDSKISVGGPDLPEDPTLASFSVPALAPNEIKDIPVPFTISPRQPAGKYFVGVALNPGNWIAEYSFTNNVNPFLTGDHGNAPITVN